MEIELKFALSAEAAAALRAGELAGEGRDIRSVYYDTRDHALRAAGFALRLRETNGRRLQGLKSLAGVARFEREDEVGSDAPDARPLADTPVANVVGGRSLEPLFESRVRRVVSTVEVRETSIEVALDEGELVAGARAAPILELEMELKAGAPERLFEEAERWRGHHGLRVSLSSKAARGYGLLDDGWKGPAKVTHPPLLPEMSGREAFGVLAMACLTAFEANLRLVQVGDSLEAVHQARVALRRLRAILGAFRRVADDGRRETIEQALRDFAGRFGEARDLDVFIAETFRPTARHEPGSAAFGRRLLAAQAAARDTLRRDLAGGEAEAFLLDILRWLHTGDWTRPPTLPSNGELALDDQPLGELAPMLLHKVWKRFKAREKGLDWADPHGRHRLRIQAKKLRYVGDAVDAVCPHPKGFDKALRKFQDAAGRLNDLNLAPKIARAALGEAAPRDATFAAGEIVGAARADEAALIREARARYKAVLDKGPYW